MTFRRAKRLRAERATNQGAALMSPHPFADRPDAGGTIPDGSRHFENVFDAPAPPDDKSVRFARPFADDDPEHADVPDGTRDFGHALAADAETTP